MAKDPVGEVLGKVLQLGRDGAARAARLGRERLALRQLRADRDALYRKLGKEARELVEAAEIDHPGLRRAILRVKEIEGRIADAEAALLRRGETPEPDVEAPAGDVPQE
jgi:hypothetical protein